MYKTMYPASFTPRFHGLPKIHKAGTPRPVVSSRGSVTYGVAKVLAKVLKTLVGKPPHHPQSTRDFVNRVREVTVLQGECLCSYDVTALFTSVPIDPVLNIFKDLLEQDDTFHDRTVLSVQNIIEPLGFCLHNTFFSFQDKFYEQVEGAAIGPLVSPIVANLYMEYFEREALHSASTPWFWFRFLDDIFCHQQQSHKQLFLEHINNIGPTIKFTVEGIQENGVIPFLETLVISEVDNPLSISVTPSPSILASTYSGTAIIIVLLSKMS